MILQGMEGGWVVIEASHTVSSGSDVTCHMLIIISLFQQLVLVHIYSFLLIVELCIPFNFVNF